MNKQIWREVRFSLYLSFLLNGIIIQWIAPFQYKCNFSDEKCFACGLRTAVNQLLQGHFSKAYQSNKLIVVIAVAGGIMAADVLHYLYQKAKGNADTMPCPESKK